MPAKNQHVVPHGDKWAVKSEGSRRVTSVFETKREAIDAGRELAERYGQELLVHGKSGQIFRSNDSPGVLSEKMIRDAVRGISSAKLGRAQAPSDYPAKSK
jgi:hypothetical protein